MRRRLGASRQADQTADRDATRIVAVARMFSCPRWFVPRMETSISGPSMSSTRLSVTSPVSQVTSPM
ncbi:hypothetical protein AB5I41_14725 [Sphingomonas sp. MMS24-JH45]